MRRQQPYSEAITSEFTPFDIKSSLLNKNNNNLVLWLQGFDPLNTNDVYCFMPQIINVTTKVINHITIKAKNTILNTASKVAANYKYDWNRQYTTPFPTIIHPLTLTFIGNNKEIEKYVSIPTITFNNYVNKDHHINFIKQKFFTLPLADTIRTSILGELELKQIRQQWDDEPFFSKKKKHKLIQVKFGIAVIDSDIKDLEAKPIKLELLDRIYELLISIQDRKSYIYNSDFTTNSIKFYTFEQFVSYLNGVKHIALGKAEQIMQDTKQRAISTNLPIEIHYRHSLINRHLNGIDSKCPEQYNNIFLNMIGCDKNDSIYMKNEFCVLRIITKNMEKIKQQEFHPDFKNEYGVSKGLLKTFNDMFNDEISTGITPKQVKKWSLTQNDFRFKFWNACGTCILDTHPNTIKKLYIIDIIVNDGHAYEVVNKDTKSHLSHYKCFPNYDNILGDGIEIIETRFINENGPEIHNSVIKLIEDYSPTLFNADLIRLYDVIYVYPLIQENPFYPTKFYDNIQAAHELAVYLRNKFNVPVIAHGGNTIIHPTSGYIISYLSEEYKTTRKLSPIFANVLKDLKCSNLSFCTQMQPTPTFSYQSMNMFLSLSGNVDLNYILSHHDANDILIYDKCLPFALKFCLPYAINTPRFAIDMRSAYSTVILNNIEKWCVFNEFDNFQPFDPLSSIHSAIPSAQYVIPAFIGINGIISNKPTIVHRTGILKLISSNRLKLEDIIYIRIPSKYVDSKVLNPMILLLMKLAKDGIITDDESKSIRNTFTGFTGITHKKQTSYFTSNNKNDAMDCMYDEILDNKKDVTFNFREEDGFWFGEKTIKTRKMNDITPFYSQIIDLCRTELINLVDDFTLTYPNYRIISYATDSIIVEGIIPEYLNFFLMEHYFRYNVNTAIKPEHPYNLSEQHRDKMILQATTLSNKNEAMLIIPKSLYEIVEPFTEVKSNDEFMNIYKTTGIPPLVDGEAGSGKSYFLQLIANELGLIKDEVSSIFLAKTHATLANLTKIPSDKKKTIDSVFYKGMNVNKEIIIIDEFFMLNHKDLINIERANNNGSKIFAFGDPFQTTPIMELIKDISDHPKIRRMFNSKRYTMDYNPITGRHDLPLKNGLDKIKETGMIPRDFTFIQQHEFDALPLDESAINITVFSEANNTHKKLTSCIDLKIGSIIRIRDNKLKKLGIINGSEYKIARFSKIDENIVVPVIIVNDKEVELKYSTWEYYQVITADRCQGKTIHGKAYIHQLDLAKDLNKVYTMMSRCKTLKNTIIVGDRDIIRELEWEWAKDMPQEQMIIDFNDMEKTKSNLYKYNKKSTDIKIGDKVFTLGWIESNERNKPNTLSLENDTKINYIINKAQSIGKVQRDNYTNVKIWNDYMNKMQEVSEIEAKDICDRSLNYFIREQIGKKSKWIVYQDSGRNKTIMSKFQFGNKKDRDKQYTAATNFMNEIKNINRELKQCELTFSY